MNLEFFTNLPAQVAVFIMAMLPVTELRGSIPFAMKFLDLSYIEILSYSIMGAWVPSLFIMTLVGPVSSWLIRRNKLAARFFNWTFERTRHKFAKKYETWGNWALMIFVAIPLPGTGVWTGSLAAWLFGLKKKSALLYIALGAIISGFVVLLISLGAFSLF